MSTALNRIDLMLNRAVDACEDYRRRLDESSKQTAMALMRTFLTMMAEYDHAHAYTDDHEHEQRLVFIMSANFKALRNEMLK